MKPTVYKLGRFFLWYAADEKQAEAGRPAVTETVKEIHLPSPFFKKIPSDYLLVLDSATQMSCDLLALRRLLLILRDTQAGLIYSDFLCKAGNDFVPHPLNDYQPGSICDDFNFGHFFIISAAAIKTALEKHGAPPNDAATALYDLRLKISIDHEILHVPEFLYTISRHKFKPAKTSDGKTETHFDYVAKENFARQKKLENIASNYLKQIGAYLTARTQKAHQDPEAFIWEASVVIPVLNRKKTIADALTSALAQKTNFAFNVIVVDNHSTDGTTGILKKFAEKYPNVQHLIPSRRDLGIGGCWNEAIYSPYCGRYVIQLDSDDLYSSPQTLQKIVSTLHKGQYAMVVGSYALVNERLKPIPPGLIDHREWTSKNGHNNLLRVNGLGAPRAYSTSVIRRFGFPNVSYGEDYAAGIRISREYKIGRIYESLYLCRRWTDNTDASLSVEKQNRNDFYKDKLRTMEIQARQQFNGKERSPGISRTCLSLPADVVSPPDHIFAEFSGKENVTLPALCRNLFKSQKKSWPALTMACRDLASVQERELLCDNYQITLQYNPARAISGAAAVDPESIRKRPCFLCIANRPSEQHGILYRHDYMILCNPAPIFNHHFTIVSIMHKPQEIASSLDALMQIAADASPGYTVFYNGPACGASAPDHLHFQMIPSDALPFLNVVTKLPPIKKASSVRVAAENGFNRAVVIMESRKADTLKEQFILFLKATQKILPTIDEPLMNVLCDYEKDYWRLTVFLRRKHRPDAYWACGAERIFVSPGAIDMAGVVIIPLLKDYERLDCNTVRNIYREVSIDEQTLNKIIRDYKK